MGQDWQWPPFTAQVYTDYANELTKVKAGSETLVDAMNNLQTLETQYATDQGFTVVPRSVTSRHAGCTQTRAADGL